MRIRDWTFFRDNSGVAAVEMALVAPAIAVLAFTAFNVWNAYSRDEDMRAALKAGATYYMTGGTSDSTAQSVAMSAWSNPPSNASVNPTRSCYCATTPQDCAILCDDGTSPSIYVTLTATGTTPSAAVMPSLSEREVIRVR